jgi:hypothetical protein
MNTIIEPLDGEFDIDDGIYFKVEAEPLQGINTFHRWIFEAVDGHTNKSLLTSKPVLDLPTLDNITLIFPFTTSLKVKLHI